MSAKLVKELRERTGLGLLECKKALAAADGDVDKAIEELRKSSGMKAAKKAGRTAADGVVTTRVAEEMAMIDCIISWLAPNIRSVVEGGSEESPAGPATTSTPMITSARPSRWSIGTGLEMPPSIM